VQVRACLTKRLIQHGIAPARLLRQQQSLDLRDQFRGLASGLLECAAKTAVFSFSTSPRAPSNTTAVLGIWAARAAKPSVRSVSCRLREQGFTAAISTALALPPRVSCNR